MDVHELSEKLKNNTQNIEEVLKWCIENAERLSLSDKDEIYLCESATKYLMENKLQRTWSKEEAKFVVMFFTREAVNNLNLAENVDIKILDYDEYIEKYGDNSNGICVTKDDGSYDIAYVPKIIDALISNDKYAFLEGLQTIYHEIRHAQQNKSMRNEKNDDGTNRSPSKERYLSALETIVRRGNRKFYKENYSKLLKENDAQKYGLVKAMATLAKYAPFFVKQYNLRTLGTVPNVSSETFGTVPNVLPHSHLY